MPAHRKNLPKLLCQVISLVLLVSYCSQHAIVGEQSASAEWVGGGKCENSRQNGRVRNGFNERSRFGERKSQTPCSGHHAGGKCCIRWRCSAYRRSSP